MNNSIEYLISNASLSYINPLICGEEKCEPSHSFGPHKRNYYLLHYVVDGKGIFKSNGNIYSVNADECFVIRPNEITYYEADENEPWKYVWIGFTTDIPLPNAIIETDIIHNDNLRHLFLSLKNVCEIEYKKEEYLSSIIFKMFQALAKPTNTKNQLVEKAKLYIDTNYMNNISVSSIAEQLHINRSYFYKLFRKEEGVSPQEYLCSFRLNQAMLMLKRTDKSISEIAIACGFSDVFVFSKAYKTKFKHSPKQERIKNI